MKDLPSVKRGQPITATLWNQFAAAVRACRLISGDGVRLRETPDGTIISFDGDGGEFAHPWQVSLVGSDTATIRPGTVNRVEARIKGVLLAGTEKQPAPLLKFGKPKLDVEGRGFICAEVTCRVKDWSVEKVEIVQVANPNTPDGAPSEAHGGSGGAVALPGGRARHPLAMLRQRDGGKLDLIQISFFDLQHRVALSQDGKSAARHFFWQ